MTNPPRKFGGQPFGLISPVLLNGKEETFWHLISREGSRSRVRDPERCERIRWPRRIIDLAVAGSAEVVKWTSRHGQEHRTRLALQDFSYVVVLVEKGARVLLLTAFPVDKRHERRKLRRQWQRAQKI